MIYSVNSYLMNTYKNKEHDDYTEFTYQTRSYRKKRITGVINTNYTSTY